MLSFLLASSRARYCIVRSHAVHWMTNLLTLLIIFILAITPFKSGYTALVLLGVIDTLNLLCRLKGCVAKFVSRAIVNKCYFFLMKVLSVNFMLKLTFVLIKVNLSSPWRF